MGFRLKSYPMNEWDSAGSNVVMAPACKLTVFANIPMDINISFVESSEERRKKCLQLERRIDRLTRRLKLKQSKILGLHTSDQVCDLLDYCHCKSVDLESSNYQSLHSIATLDAFLKRLKRCSEQSCMPRNTEKFTSYFGSGADVLKNRCAPSSVAPKLDLDVHEHIEKITGELHAQVNAIASDFDSDATASSSGNDSFDEEPSFISDDIEESSKKLPLTKRAIWRWLRNRASIAYRLSWLQSHMSALEYKIHHYTEMYKKLRSSKGQVVLHSISTICTNSNSSSNSINVEPLTTITTTTATTTTSTTTTTMSATTTISTTTTKNNTNPQVVLNGYHATLPALFSTITAAVPKNESLLSENCIMNTNCSLGISSDGDTDDISCSRTQPYVRAKFRKRNLIRTNALPKTNTLSKTNTKVTVASKYATVRCDCVPPLTCFLCACRGPGVDLSNQHMRANLLPVQSKIALLEPTYHPVLSFTSDVSVSTHICALLSNENVVGACAKTIESRTAVQTPVAVKRQYANYKTSEEIRRANSENSDLYKKRRKYGKRQTNASQSVLYGRTQLGKRRHPKYLNDKSLFRKKRRRRRIKPKRFCRGTGSGLDESADEGLYYKREKDEAFNSQPGSPHSSHSSTVKDPIRRKRGQSYDIDNFIIPPNSTPALVASKPQYKEILIPTWKLVDENDELENIDRNSIPEYILEDLSNEKVLALHDILEQSERKKFRTHPTRNKTGHGRSRKRTDSCPEDANTPERVASPVSSNSELDPAVSTKTNTTTADLTSITNTTQMTTASTNKGRTLSLNRLKSNSLDCDDLPVTDTSSTVAPYESRVFPLSDEAYREMLKSNNIHNVKNNNRSENGQPNEEKLKENGSSDQSPLSVNSQDSLFNDPDDPDWTMQVEEVSDVK